MSLLSPIHYAVSLIDADEPSRTTVHQRRSIRLAAGLRVHATTRCFWLFRLVGHRGAKDDLTIVVRAIRSARLGTIHPGDDPLVIAFFALAQSTVIVGYDFDVFGRCRRRRRVVPGTSDGVAFARLKG